MQEKFLDVFSFPLYFAQGKLEYVVEVIQDNTQLLATVLREVELPSDKRNQLYERIISRSQHGLKTVENFLIYSRIKAGELEITPVKTNFLR